MKNKVLYTLAAALATSFAATTAHAVAQSDEVIYTPTAFDRLIPEGYPDPASEFLPAFAPAPQGLPDQVILMLEPGGVVGGQGQVSDALWVQAGWFYFESDWNEQPLVYWPASGVNNLVATVVENGQLQDLGVLLLGPTGGPGYLPPGTLLVSSDVPEPSTLALIGMGGTALATLLRRRKL